MVNENTYSKLLVRIRMRKRPFRLRASSFQADKRNEGGRRFECLEFILKSRPSPANSDYHNKSKITTLNDRFGRILSSRLSHRSFMNCTIQKGDRQIFSGVFIIRVSKSSVLCSQFSVLSPGQKALRGLRNQSPMPEQSLTGGKKTIYKCK
jgi:hypothetical protein